MQKMYSRTARAVRRVPYSDRVIRAMWTRTPPAGKRFLRRTRHRLFMRTPSSMLSRAVTPGVQNRLLSNPDVVEQLLKTDRARDLLSHQPASSGKNVDWVAQVALNDPAGVVHRLATLAARHPHVDAAIDRLTAGRPTVLSEEQVIDVFLGLPDFERRKYWTNPRIRDAFLEYLCRDRNVAQTRDLFSEKLDVFEHPDRVRAVIGEGDSQGQIAEPTDQFDARIEPPVAADILLSIDRGRLSELWDIESFRSAFVDDLLDDDDLFHLRMLMRSERFKDGRVRQVLFDALASAQTLQLMTSGRETVVLPTADLGFAKAYWADRDEQLAHLDRFLAARASVKRPHGTCFVDVGANIGTHTVHALNSGFFGSGVVIEPDPRLLPILKANLALNQMDKRIEVIECAAGDAEGEVSFWCNEVNWGDNRLSAEEGDGWYEMTVPVRTVDQILAIAGVAPSDVGALWIDVQGHEQKVLEGARQAVDAGCDIVVEFWPAVLSKHGTLESTVDRFLSISASWMDLETGDLLDQAGLEAMQQVGIETGESFYADLAVVHGIMGQTRIRDRKRTRGARTQISQC